MQLARPFIRLPLHFDAARLAEEAAALPESAWMPHPTGQPGNSGLPLISRRGGHNDDFVGPMAPTPHLQASPYHRQVMASFGEVLARSRLMRLRAGSEVGLHVDFNYHWYSRVRIHVPVITSPAVTFHCGDAAVHMAPGECWLFDNWRPHNVINAGTADRVHLVIDLAGSSRFWRTVRDMAAFDPLEDAAGIDRHAREIPYRPGHNPPVTAERFNAAPVMAPGEVDALTREVIGDLARHPDNDRQMLARYALLLGDFARDWRELWHRHGIGAEGFPGYRQLIETTAGALAPDPRALVLSSNGVGANPVIMQRILRPALMPALAEQFRAAGDSAADGPASGAANARAETVEPGIQSS